MNFLLIGSDKKLLDASSDAFRRHAGYFAGHHAFILVLGKGGASSAKSGEVEARSLRAMHQLHSFFRAFFFLRRKLRKEKYDLIATQDVLLSGLLGFVLSRMHKIPLVVQLHGDYLDNPLWLSQKLIYRPFNIIGKYILRRAEGVRVVSGRLKKEVIEKFKIPEEKVVSIPIGTDFSIYEPPSSWPMEQNIIFVGRLIPEKSPMLFCEVVGKILENHPDVKIIIAGEGYLKEEMREFFRKRAREENVSFLGHVDSRALSSWYKKSYLMIHTASWEGWGMPMIEAMASGVPVVSVDSGCAGEVVIDGKNGFVTPVDDREALVEKTEKLIVDRKLKDVFSKEAVYAAGNWSLAALSERLLNFYRECAKKGY